MIRYATLVLATTLAIGCGSDDPAARTPVDTPAAREVPRQPSVLPSAETIHGLPIPRGSERTASNDLGDDFLVPGDVVEVTAFITSNLIDGTPQTSPGNVFRFRRVTPRGQDPDEMRLFILVMPYSGGRTLMRVQRLPATELTPEQLRENVERFQREQDRLD